MRKHELEENLADLAQVAEQDHEVQLARGELYKLAKYSIKLHEMLKSVSEEAGLEGWVQAKITKASDYISSVYHHLDYDTKFAESKEVVSEGFSDSEDVANAIKTELDDLGVVKVKRAEVQSWIDDNSQDSHKTNTDEIIDELKKAGIVISDGTFGSEDEEPGKEWFFFTNNENIYMKDTHGLSLDQAKEERGTFISNAKEKDAWNGYYHMLSPYWVDANNVRPPEGIDAITKTIKVMNTMDDPASENGYKYYPESHKGHLMMGGKIAAIYGDENLFN